MSYVLHPAARVAARPYFADFKPSLAWTGPGKIAHLFTVIGATIPLYLFSYAYHAAKTSRTWRKRTNYSFFQPNRRSRSLLTLLLFLPSPPHLLNTYSSCITATVVAASRTFL